MAFTILHNHTQKTDHREHSIYKVMTAQSAAQTTSDEFSVADAHILSLSVVTGAGVSGGVVTLEGSPTSGYTGTWESLATITTNAATTVFGVNTDIEDNTSGMGAELYVRVRISTVISGGTVDVYLGVDTQ